MDKSENQKGKLIAVALWIVIVAILAVSTKFLVMPYFQKKLEGRTSSKSFYKREVKIAVDSFSGYSVLRSESMRNDLKAQGIKLTINDDKADYEARMKSLRSKKVQMAVFTIDSFLLTGAKQGEFPATIVMMIDETKGADAIVSYKAAVANLQDLNYKDAGIVLTPQSPSEFLARTIIAHFNLPNLPEKWQIAANGASDVYEKFQSADRSQKRAYVLWEPYVSKALETPGATLLLDSSKLEGYIVDILVAERGFLQDNPDVVKSVVESYFRAAYNYNQATDGMKNLVMEDAKTTGSEKLTPEQAEKLVKGIEWKNTLENYAYLGLLDNRQSQGFQQIEDVIGNITDVLIKTGAIENDPLNGKPNTIYYDQTLRQLQAAGFHPGKKVNIIKGVGLGEENLEQVRKTEALPALSDAQWEKLSPVGQMRVEPISFARGTDRINVQSERDLDELAKNLNAWPQYYVMVVGHTRAEGDQAANQQLSKDRATRAEEYLISVGIDKNRIMVIAAPPSGTEGTSQAVSFELRQSSY